MLSETSQKEKDKYHAISLTYGILKKEVHRYRENRLVVARGGAWGMDFEMGKRSQKVQTSSYKINESWGCNVQHGVCSS